MGAVAPKSCTRVITRYLTSRHVDKFYKAILPGSKDLAPNTLNFKLIFDSLLKKVVRGNFVPNGVCASKTWSFSGARKNLGAQQPL